jgi:phosphoribosylformylglycinamidine cyclo-ligase
VTESRGESAYVLDVGPFYLASIVECLGTKTLVADEMQKLTGRSWYAGIAQDTIAMAINDLITVGATPLVVQAYWAAGGSDWFADADRAQALVAGWKAACDTCQVAWGGGETPALAGIVEAGRIDLAASCTGLVNPRTADAGRKAGPGRRHRAAGFQRHPRQRPEPGAQAGRTAATGLPDRDGARPGLRRSAAGPHHAVLAGDRSAVAGRRARALRANITGHGWRKLLRHPKPLRYRVHTVPPVPPVLAFIQQQAGQDAEEAYGTLNMGAGFALFVHADDAERTVAVALAQDCGGRAWVAGWWKKAPRNC